MADVGVLKSDDKRPKFRQRKPHWHLPLEHASLAAALAPSAYGSFAGDHQHGPGAIRLSAPQKPEKRGVRLSLSMPVQVDAHINRINTARHPLFKTPAQRHKRWRLCR
jgi:hypothetical protein